MTRSIALLCAALPLACGTGRQAVWEQPPETAAPAAAAAAAPADAYQTALDDAKAGWANRGDRASVEKAIAALERATSLKPEDGESLAFLARAYFFLADGHLRHDAAARMATYEKGTAAGERALVALNPDFRRRVTSGEKVDQAIGVVGSEGLSAMYWYATNLGKWATDKGLAARLGNKDRIYAVMSRVLALDEKYFHGAPHRYFGAYYAILPGFAGRDMNKSKDHFEKALAIAPNYPATRVLYAQWYAVGTQNRPLFDEQLKAVLDAKEDAVPDVAPEIKNEKEKARELLAKADDLF